MEKEKVERETQQEQISSVEISVNAKNQISGKVKVYNNNTDEALKEAEKLILNITSIIIPIKEENKKEEKI